MITLLRIERDRRAHQRTSSADRRRRSCRSRRAPTGAQPAAAAFAAGLQRRRRRLIGVGGIDHATSRPSSAGSASTQRLHSPAVAGSRRHPARRASSARTSRPSARDDRRRSTPVAARPCRASTCDTMNSIGRSASCCAQQRRGSPAGRQRRRAPAASVPISLSCRAVSSARLTSSRIARSRVPARVERRRRRSASSVGRGKQREVHRLLARAAARQVPPQLVGRHRQDRRQQPRQAVGHHVHRRLRRAPLAASPRAKRVEPILRHVGVERAQVDGRGTGSASGRSPGSRSARRPRSTRRRDLAVARQDVAIDLLQPLERHAIGRRIEVVEVRRRR